MYANAWVNNIWLIFLLNQSSHFISLHRAAPITALSTSHSTGRALLSMDLSSSVHETALTNTNTQPLSLQLSSSTALLSIDHDIARVRGRKYQRIRNTPSSIMATPFHCNCPVRNATAIKQ